MPVTYVDENGKQTNFENADFAVISALPVKVEKIITCPNCKKKRKESDFVELGVCRECNEKILENPKVARGKKRGVERTGHWGR